MPRFAIYDEVHQKYVYCAHRIFFMKDPKEATWWNTSEQASQYLATLDYPAARFIIVQVTVTVEKMTQ